MQKLHVYLLKSSEADTFDFLSLSGVRLRRSGHQTT